MFHGCFSDLSEEHLLRSPSPAVRPAPWCLSIDSGTSLMTQRKQNKTKTGHNVTQRGK